MHHHPPSSASLLAAGRQPAAAHPLAGRCVASILRRIGVPLLTMAMLLMALDLAEAKRVGGGKSFGSRDTYSKPYNKPTSPDRNTSTVNQQSAPDQPGGSAAAGAPAARPGMFGGLGGMFGGLLMGGLIGSMLFGGGVGTGGIGILEILLLGGGAYLLFRLFAGRKTHHMRQPASGAERFAYATGPGGNPDTERTQDGWGKLHSTPPGRVQENMPPPAMPAGLDETEFLAGVKTLYSRLQASWDRRDLDDIRQFTTPEVFSEIARQAEEDPTPGKTEILMVEARVLEAGSHGGQTVITVFFDVLLREDQSAGNPEQVREVWRISRNELDPRPSWNLEGIQQLAM